ncbi:Uncharacterised protein [uncultured archaeon]|nr:Uncharacterised protein [uncultured archaeon]
MNTKWNCLTYLRQHPANKEVIRESFQTLETEEIIYSLTAGVASRIGTFNRALQRPELSPASQAYKNIVFLNGRYNELYQLLSREDIDDKTKLSIYMNAIPFNAIGFSS